MRVERASRFTWNGGGAGLAVDCWPRRSAAATHPDVIPGRGAAEGKGIQDPAAGSGRRLRTRRGGMTVQVVPGPPSLAATRLAGGDVVRPGRAARHPRQNPSILPGRPGPSPFPPPVNGERVSSAPGSLQRAHPAGRALHLAPLGEVGARIARGERRRVRGRAITGEIESPSPALRLRLRSTSPQRGEVKVSAFGTLRFAPTLPASWPGLSRPSTP